LPRSESNAIFVVFGDQFGSPWKPGAVVSWSTEPGLAGSSVPIWTSPFGSRKSKAIRPPFGDQSDTSLITVVS
jgi:hypothetical protein